jgi:hypothetical protein
MKNDIIVFICYARSGGTLFNKVLNGLSDYVVLSEISPQVGVERDALHHGLVRLTPSWQMRNWHGLELQDDTFSGQIQEVERYCKDVNKVLVIRDWSYINFNFDDKLPGHVPSKSFEMIDLLKNEYNVKIVGLVRNTVDVWISMGRPNMAKFVKAYGGFIEKLNSINARVIKFEDFTSNPAEVLKSISSVLNFFNEISNVDLLNEKHVNGDVLVVDSYRKGDKRNIVRMSRKPIYPWEFINFNIWKDKIDKINKVNGYRSDFFVNYSFKQYCMDLYRKVYLKIRA